tara:strand:- start:751 stop:1107 length:357 start_codon:yes stop_codon:yes gene_type:complete
MFLRSEKRSIRIKGVYLLKGDTVEIPATEASIYKEIIDSGLVSLLDRDPNKKASTTPKAACKPKCSNAADDGECKTECKVEAKSKTKEKKAATPAGKKSRRKRGPRAKASGGNLTDGK